MSQSLRQTTIIAGSLKSIRSGARTIRSYWALPENWKNLMSISLGKYTSLENFQINNILSILENGGITAYIRKTTQLT